MSISVDGEDFARVLNRLYGRRYSEADLRELSGIWRVLVRDFFQARIRPGSTVLDIGAGSCAFINAVTAGRRIAVDANPAVRDTAGPGVEVVVTDDLSLPSVPDGSVDHVFVSNFLEHLHDHLEVLRLLTVVRRKLSPGGTLMVLQPNFRLSYDRYFDYLDHRVALTDASLVEAVEVAGFRVKDLRVRFLPFTTKSRLPTWPWIVALYLRLPPAQWLVGRQTFLEAVKVDA